MTVLPARSEDGEELWSGPGVSTYDFDNLCRRKLPFVGGASPCRASPTRFFAITLSSELRVAGPETEHMPFYLRTFFRVLSSWVRSARRALRALGGVAPGQLPLVGSDLSECGRRVGRRQDIWMLIGGRPLPHALRAERTKRMNQDDDPLRVAHRTLHVAVMMIAGPRLRYERTT